MEASVKIDGKEVRFRASAAVPRLYRIKFRRDILQDLTKVKKALEDKERDGTSLPMEALELFENMAYLMAKHADQQAVPESADAWLDQFDTMSIYQVFPVIEALWSRNMERLAEAKKKLEQSTEK